MVVRETPLMGKDLETLEVIDQQACWLESPCSRRLLVDGLVCRGPYQRYGNGGYVRWELCVVFGGGSVDDADLATFSCFDVAAVVAV